MKKLISLTIIFAAIVIVVTGQTINSTTKTLKYGVEASRSSLGSGFSPAAELQFQLQTVRKRSIGLGIYFDTEYQRIAGITFNHKWFLFTGKMHHEPVISPYIMYHYIFRNTAIPEVTDNKDHSGPIVHYKSMEHHLTFGTRIRITRSFYINGDLGYGLYLGSIKKPSAPDPITHEIVGTNGFGLISRIGFGVNI